MNNTKPHIDNNNNKMDTDMIEEIAEVVSVESGFAHVRPFSTSACSGCSSKSGCSSATSFFSSKKKSDSLIKVQNPVYAKPGDQVVIGVRAGALVSSSLLAYVLPVLTLLMCAVLGTEIFRYLSLNPELGSIIFGFSGLMLGFYIVRGVTQQAQACNNLDVIILRIKEQDVGAVAVNFSA